MQAIEHHPKAASIRYDVACCECQLGDFEAAKRQLDKAFRLNPRCRITAVDDEDLMPMLLILEED